MVVLTSWFKQLNVIFENPRSHQKRRHMAGKLWNYLGLSERWVAKDRLDGEFNSTFSTRIGPYHCDILGGSRPCSVL